MQYFGYDVASYKITVMAISAAIAGLAGMLYTIVMSSRRRHSSTCLSACRW